MAQRAALVSGGSSGIGLAIARMLGEEGYALTVSARRPEKLEEAAETLRSEGYEVLSVPANMANEDEVVRMVAAHSEHYGRLDVLANNAGVGFGQPIGEIVTKRLDMQLDVNLRSMIIATREALPMLLKAGAEHRKALIANTASIAGKAGQGWLSVYSASKFGAVGFSQATQKELDGKGIQVMALCPGFVDTPMTEFAKDSVPVEDMIQPSDIAEAVRFALRTSPACLVPEVVFTRPGELLGAAT